MNTATSEAKRRAGAAPWSLPRLSLVPQPTLLMAIVLSCDCISLAGAGTPWAPPVAEYALGVWLVLWALGAAGNVADYVGLGLLRAWWACWAHIGAQLIAFGLSLANLALRIDQGAAAVLPYGVALSAGALLLSLLTSRLARSIEADPLWDDTEDWDDA